MDLARKILSDLTVYMKYGRYIADQQRRETWDEIVTRNIDMHIKKFPNLEGEIREQYKLIYDKKVLPSMRALQFGGKPIEISPNRQYNCLGVETRFITSEGVKSFADFQDGNKIKVLTHLGNWKNATVKSYGKQDLVKINFVRGRTKKTIRATRNHRWILKNETETTDLGAGDILYPSPKIYHTFQWEECSFFEKLYWCYGFVYGDSTVNNYGNSHVRLCGKDTRFANRFEELGFKTSSPLSIKGDIFVYLGSYQKTAPDLKIDNPELIKAFVTGYLDADGYKNPDWYRNQELSPYKSIQSSQKDHFDFIEKAFESIGLYLLTKRDLTGEVTNFRTRPETYSYSLTNQIGTTPQSSHWSVKTIERDKEETVWCLEVEDDHSFVLSGGIVTGNCAFTALNSWETFGEVMFLLLGGTGVGYSVQRHHIEQLPFIKSQLKRSRRHLINDSIEGWADAVKVLLKSYFFGLCKPRFDFSDIREKGALLVTSGGRAPGPQPLKDCLHNLEKIMDTKEIGSQLSPLECHDMICYIADAVLAGGIRRAALISLFSMDDEEMLTCKYGDWVEMNPQRGRANNSAVILRHKIRKKKFMELWARIKLSGSGEPGIYFTNDKEWGCNPSLPEGTKVLTSSGIFPIEKLEDEEFMTQNLDGVLSPAKCWLSGENEQLYQITLVGGHKYYATAQHQWPVLIENTIVKLRSDQLQADMHFPVVLKQKLFDGNIGTYEDGFVLGWQLGDGWLTYKSDSNRLQHGFIVNKEDQHCGIATRIETYLQQFGSNAKFSKNGELNTTNKSLDSNLEKFGAAHKSLGLPKAVWQKGTEEFRKGIIDALFSSDGHVEKHDKRICFTSCHERLAKDLSELLGFYGIKTTIKHKIRKDIFGKNQEYHSYKLIIGDNRSILHFAGMFKLTNVRKQSLINKYHFNRTKSKGIKIKSVKLTKLKEKVWDISVFDDTHCFNLAHCVTGNCGEIGLRDKQFCNLTTVNVSDIQDQADLNARVAAASFIGTLQASYTDFHYLRDIWRATTEKDALVGVSMTGIASGKVLDFDLREAAEIVVEENSKLAKIIGIKAAARLTCIKPEGCLSKDSMISMQEGILSLEEITPDNINQNTQWYEHNYTVNTDKSQANSPMFFNNGYKLVYKLTTSSGLELQSTPDHKFRVLREGKYEWIPATAINIGDYLPYSLGEYKKNDCGALQELAMVTFATNKYASNLKSINQPLLLTDDLAWLLGLYFADGSNHKKGIRISSNLKEQKGFCKAKNIMQEQFDLIGQLYKTQPTSKDKRVQLYFNSVQLIPFLEANGLSKQKSQDIEIPLLIRKSPAFIIKAFIDGYSCGDGCNKSPTKSWCTTSKKMATQLVVVLRAIGIDCKLREMPPTESSFGNEMRYWIQERKGREGNIIKQKKELRQVWSELDSHDLSHMSADKVVGLDLKYCNTYDINVENVHQYLANSYVSHNTASLVIGTSSGIHGWHSKYYIRRIRVLKNEAIYKYIKRALPHLVEDDAYKPQIQAIISLPVRAPDGATYRTETAIDLLERIKRFNIEWVLPGHLKGENTHNVSATISVKDDEWPTVGKWMWENRVHYNGLTVIPFDGGSYIQAPHETCSQKVYEEMLELLKNIDLRKVTEEEDNTNLKGEIACGGPEGCAI